MPQFLNLQEILCIKGFLPFSLIRINVKCMCVFLSIYSVEYNAVYSACQYLMLCSFSFLLSVIWRCRFELKGTYCTSCCYEIIRLCFHSLCVCVCDIATASLMAGLMNILLRYSWFHVYMRSAYSVSMEISSSEMSVFLTQILPALCVLIYHTDINVSTCRTTFSKQRSVAFNCIV